MTDQVGPHHAHAVHRCAGSRPAGSRLHNTPGSGARCPLSPGEETTAHADRDRSTRRATELAGGDGGDDGSAGGPGGHPAGGVDGGDGRVAAGVGEGRQQGQDPVGAVGGDLVGGDLGGVGGVQVGAQIQSVVEVVVLDDGAGRGAVGEQRRRVRCRAGDRTDAGAVVVRQLQVTPLALKVAASTMVVGANASAGISLPLFSLS